MTIEQALTQILLADPAVSAIVGGVIVPQQTAQGTFPTPCVIYTASDPEQQMSVSGYINLYRTNLRYDCYGGSTYTSAKAIGAAVHSALTGFLAATPSGNVGTGPGSIHIQGIFDAGGEDGLDPPVHGDEHGIDYVGVQIRVWFNFN